MKIVLDPGRVDQLERSLAALPSFHVVRRPTPLHELPRFSKALGGLRILVKREDMSGLALGGNKTRELDYFLGAALAEGADTFIAGGGVAQSNHAVQCAAGAIRAGMRPVVVLRPDRADRQAGNHLLGTILGTEIHFTSAPPGEVSRGSGLAGEMDRIAEEYRSSGHRPWVLHSSFHPLGAVGFVDCVLELAKQLQEQGVDADHIYVTSTGATQTGLLLGSRFLGLKLDVVGIANGKPASGYRLRMADLGNQAARLLGLPTRLTEQDVLNHCYAGDGYGQVSPEGREAMTLLAQTEGIFVDPVYSSKGLAGLIDHIRQGRIGARETVVFVHTGGVAAIFAYGPELVGEQTASDEG